MKSRNLVRDLLSFGVIIFLSGCRFGNYADSPTQTVSSNITKSELFFTGLSGFETYVYFNDGTSVSNTSSPPVSVPDDIRSIFTNPVYLDTYIDGTQFFWDNAQSESNPFITQVDASGQIQVESDDPSTGPVQFYQNSNCMTQIQTIQNGALNRKSPGTTVLPGSSAYAPVAGHLQLDITSIQTITGDCADDLQELANCFQNGTGCDSDQLSRAQMFVLFVNGTHILNIQDASKIIKLEYIVHFE